MKPEYRLSVDYLQDWPLNDIMLPDPRPDWDRILTPELSTRLFAWATFFNDHVDMETGMFGSELRRLQFDQEGAELLHELQQQAGHLFDFRLVL
ncbi:hypothetical protein [Galbitalea soli]|uniref:Uncharacterized protein n=1 Tax=Galbitalea soli TaxID=1268042 RepID=A0A7C9PN94_9MICO|nr:hypothetical protein [Galbitalea soli]NEM91490.1 hypothetical protein [Galbitalea soli]NYJ30183.1 hypothetical protein [Galbitalea soli]